MEVKFAVINKDKEVREAKKINSSEPRFYTLIGKEDFKDETGQPRVNEEDVNKTFAKVVNNKRMILCHRNGSFIDPIDAFNTINTTQMRQGISQWNFVAVSEEVFNSYLRFLKTMNHVWLRKAERERQ